ncbi:MAG: hypothetical protein LBP33_04765 [Candidatus Adiutrix sp.]|jgi:hypothetical protein|nr:hypothetical protein [Candidatus Adiutrix sp.]
MSGRIWNDIARARQGGPEAAWPPSADYLKGRGTVSRCAYQLTPGFSPFQGHFEGRPVLPALAQVLLAKDAAQAALGRELRIEAVVQAKFLALVKPDSLLTVYAQAPEGGHGEWRFQLRNRPLGAQLENDVAFMRLKLV